MHASGITGRVWLPLAVAAAVAVAGSVAAVRIGPPASSPPRIGAPAPVASCAARAVANCPIGSPTVDAVTTDAAPTQEFADYAATTGDGWTGGDSTYSVPLPDGRIVWLFSDTFLGPLRADGTRPTTAALVNNTFVVQDGDRLTTVHGGTPGHPSAIVAPAGPDRWFWSGDGMLTGDGDLQVVYREYRRTGTDQWDFAFARNFVATFMPTDLAVPVRMDPLPSADGVAWGAALLPAERAFDGFTYVYGTVTTTGGGKAMRIARVPGRDLRSGSWQFHAGCGWSSDERSATDVVTGVSDEYSVTAADGRYLLVTADGAHLGPQIFGRWSCTPYGPFGPRAELYRMPEPGPAGSYHDRDVVAYNAHAHPGVGPAGAILVSYNVTSVDTTIGPGADQYRDPGIYRPRFVEVRLRPDRTGAG